MAQILTIQENLDLVDSFKLDNVSKNRIKNIIRSLYDSEDTRFVILKEVEREIHISHIGEFYDTNITITFKC